MASGEGRGPLSLPPPTRTATVDGRLVVVYDGLMTAVELAGLARALSASTFHRTEFARADTPDYRHWVTELDLEVTRRLPFCRLTEELAAHHFGAGRAVTRTYCNAAYYGDMLLTHDDCGPEDGDVTALWYACEEWNVEWGGETIFYDRTQDAAIAVTPRPGRLCLFDGAIVHVGRPPNRVCFRPRHTVALKLTRSRGQDGQR